MPAIPPLVVLTDRKLCAPRPLTDVVEAVVGGGARAVILREKDLPHDEREALADELRPILHAAGGLLLVASDPTIEADGIHLAASEPVPEPRPAIVGRSCHDLAEVRAAQLQGCDYVTFSPVAPSISKQGYAPVTGPSSTGPEGVAPSGHQRADGRDHWRSVAVGVERLRVACRATDVRVYALGGIDPLTAPHALSAEPAGLAVLGCAMAAPDPASVVTDLLAEMIQHLAATLDQVAASDSTGADHDIWRFLDHKLRLGPGGALEVARLARARSDPGERSLSGRYWELAVSRSGGRTS